MIIILSTTMLRDNKEFRYHTDDDDIDDLRGHLADWVSEMHPSSIAQAVITIDVEDNSGEDYELHQRLIRLMPSHEIQTIDHLFSVCRILQYVEDEASVMNIAKLIFLMGDNSLPEDPDDWIGDEDTVAFDSRGSLAEDEYYEETPAGVREYVDWDEVAENSCSYTAVEVKGETYYFKN